MTTGDRREPITLRWQTGVNDFGEASGTVSEVDTWAAPVEPLSLGYGVGELLTEARTGGAVVRIAAGGTIRPGMTGQASLTCELRGTVRHVRRVSDPDGRRRWYDLHLDA